MFQAAVEPVNVYEGQDFYVPAIRIKVQGEKQLLAVNDFISVTYSDSLKDIDSVQLTVNNSMEDTSVFHSKGFRYSDGNLFLPWKDIEIWMGYYHNGTDRLRCMLIGDITSVSPTFPQSGPCTMNVTGLNLLHKFRTKQETRPFFKKRDTEIAKLLLEDINTELKKKKIKLTLHLDPNDEKTNSKTEKPIDYLVMDNQYPIVFLAQRARDIGYELKAEEPPRGGAEVTFHFGPSTHTTRTIYKLEWGKTLVSFQPSFQVANQVAEVTVKGWNPRTKKEIKVTVKRSEVKGVVAPSELGVEEPELAKKEEIIADHPVSSKEEARGLAEARMKQIGVSLVTAKGKTIGLPDLRAGEKVEIEGVGRFSGMYFVTSTTHTIGEGGYTTDFTARREK